MSKPLLDDQSLREIEAWLAADADAPLDLAPATTELSASLEELEKIHGLVVRVIGALGRRKSIPPAARETLLAAAERRAELLSEVGSQIAAWGASGGGVRLLQSGSSAGPSVGVVSSSRTVISSGTPELASDAAGASVEPASDPVEAARPSAPQAAAAKEAPLTNDQIQAWLGRLREARPAPPSAPVVQMVPLTFEKQLAVLKSLMSTLDGPREREGSAEWNNEAESLIAAMSRDRIETWKQMSPSMQRAWLAMLVSRARAATDPSLGYPLIRSRVNAMFPRLSAFSKEEQPGYVHGLAVTHLPTRGTWLADASHSWEELEQIIEGEDQPQAPMARISSKQAKLADEADAPGEPVIVAKGGTYISPSHTSDAASDTDAASEPVAAEGGTSAEPAAEAKTPKRKIASKKTAKVEKVEATEEEPPPSTVEKAEEEDGPMPSIEESWPGWTWTRSKRAVIFGGEVREISRKRLEDAFEFTELAWVSVAQQRRVHSLVTRVASGTIDIVLVLQKFVNHKTASKVIDACREAGVAWAMVENGYGVSAIRRAIDHHLGTNGR